MTEFIEKLIGRLEEEVKSTREMQTIQCVGNNGYGTPLQAKLSGEISALLKTINIVNQLAEEYNNGWISCKERLPEVDNEVLISTDDGCIYCGCWYTNGLIMDNGCSWVGVEHILAWMPLPTPYKESEEK